MSEITTQKSSDATQGRPGLLVREIARVVRTKTVLLHLPSAFKGKHPQVSREAVIDLDALIRSALEELADGRGGDGEEKEPS